MFAVWNCFLESEPEWQSERTLQSLAADGFGTRRVRTEGLNPAEILARLRPRHSSQRAVDRNETGFAINNAFSKGPLRRAIKVSVNYCLSTFRVGDTLKAWAIRK